MQSKANNADLRVREPLSARRQRCAFRSKHRTFQPSPTSQSRTAIAGSLSVEECGIIIHDTGNTPRAAFMSSADTLLAAGNCVIGCNDAHLTRQAQIGKFGRVASR